ncbi:hypothetical protein BDQ17DRAFT_1427216 [Cyathus striatus]|nr:hypothetical protein BDQ17DRAFT_1427216 [Cyathus striatus]
MDPQYSGPSRRSRPQSQQPQVPPPLYVRPNADALMEEFDIELEDEDQPPPLYSTVFNAGRVPIQLGSRRAAPVTHEFYIKTGGKASKPWATLRLISQAESSDKAPRFFGGQVSGFVDIMLDNGGPQSVQAVTLILRGKIISTASFQGNYSIQYTFLDEQHVIWAKSSSSSTAPPSARKLEGNHSWPFSFPFPTQTEVRVRGGMQSYPIPQTFLERGTNISVQYEIALKVSHGFLRADSKLPINITYSPDIMPTPMSAIRQIAYRDGIAVPGPEIDFEGWHTISPATISGQLLQRAVEITCVLSLAKPLIYTRGTIIPLHLILGSNDTQALDILSSVKVVQVRLMQTLEYFQDPKNVAGGLEESEVITQAQWWIPQDPSAQSTGKRTLFGELHLPKDMQPSCSFLLLNIEYTVELIPFISPVFDSGQRPDHPVLSCRVKIGTVNAAGPIPKAVTSPPPRIKNALLERRAGELSGSSQLL